MAKIKQGTGQKHPLSGVFSFSEINTLNWEKNKKKDIECLVSFPITTAHQKFPAQSVRFSYWIEWFLNCVHWSPTGSMDGSSEEDEECWAGYVKDPTSPQIPSKQFLNHFIHSKDLIWKIKHSVICYLYLLFFILLSVIKRKKFSELKKIFS